MHESHKLYLGHAGLLGDPRLKGLPLVVAMTGYAEAGQAARQVGEEILETLDSQQVAEFDVDRLYDYRSRRPRVKFIEDHFEDLDLPELSLRAVTDGLGQPFLLLSGPEPDLLWQRFAQSVVELAETLDVSLVASVSSMPMPVPHTRPLPVTAHGNREDLIAGISLWKSIAELGGSAAQMLEVVLGERGFDTIGYTVNVPQYLADAELPQAALIALEHLGAATHLNLPTDRLRESGREVEQQIDDQVSGSPEVQAIVTHLEQRYDEHVGGSAQRSLLARDESEIPDADELGATIEAFLAEQDEDSSED